MTPQIDCLREMSPSLKVSTHIDGLSKEIDWKMFIFSVNLGMETPQIDCLRKTPEFQHPKGFLSSFLEFDPSHEFCF